MTNIMKLNVNGLHNKLNELYSLLNSYKPDYLCREQTNRKAYINATLINIYLIYEMRASNRGQGLLIASRYDTSLDIQIKEK